MKIIAKCAKRYHVYDKNITQKHNFNQNKKNFSCILLQKNLKGVQNGSRPARARKKLCRRMFDL